MAHDHRIPLSELNAWSQHDRDVAVGRAMFHAEACGACGVHPSAWKPELGGHMNAVVPVWQHCRVCELTEAARKAGAPTEDGGWHLVLKHQH